MAQENFDIKQWLLDVDTSRVDQSLDEEAKRLFVLNDALVNPDYGPILATHMVTAEPDCGLDALPELADCSEPRLAMMAVVNTLNILARGSLDDSEFVVPDAAGSSGNELSISKEDFPSEGFVGSKIATAVLQMSNFFIDRVSAGDFCPDFLTFLLTALMNMSVRREGEEFEDQEEKVMSVPTERFLKTIIRTWKSPELSEHRSEAENETSFNLGFLVTCYIKSLCIAHRNENDTGIEGTMDVDSGPPTGLRAVIDMGDWAVKFILMRVYSPSVGAMERAQLMAVMDHCGNHSEAFTNTLLRESALTAIWRTAESEGSNSRANGIMSPTETVAFLRNTVPSILLLNHLADHLLRGAAVPGAGIWFENKQSRITLSLCRAFTKKIRQGMRMVMFSDFPSTEEGYIQSSALISLVSHLTSHVWKAGVAVLFRAYNNPQRPLRENFLSLFEFLGSAVELFCLRRNLRWEEVSRLNRMATLQVAVNACKALKRNVDLWERMKSGETVREIEFIECDSHFNLCEWCLRVGNGPLMACGQCKQVSYCCVEHQRAHWTQGHKAECRFLRNCLEGCSFSYGEEGKLCGLKITEDEPADPDAPFGEFAIPQRNELLVLGYRLPGIMFERRRAHGTFELLYKTKFDTLKTISEFSRSWESTTHNLLIVESLMSTSCKTASMVYMQDNGLDIRTFSLHCATSEYSQSLSVRLLP